MPVQRHRRRGHRLAPVHLGRFALGGAGLVFVEAAGVEPRGRISPGDVGIWNDDQARALSRIAEFLRANGAAAALTGAPDYGLAAAPARSGLERLAQSLRHMRAG